MIDFPGLRRADRYQVAGAVFDLITTEQLTAEVIRLATSKRSCVIANHNLHSVYLLQTSGPEFAELYEMADWTHIDGMALVALARLQGIPARRCHRTTYLDWVQPLIHECFRNELRVVFLGGKPGVATRAAVALSGALGVALDIQCLPGYFDIESPEALARVEQELAAAEPDIVFVGMGMPRQEIWVARRREHLWPAVYLMSGGLFDYLAGEAASPPRFLGRIGFEWAYRLVRDPRRLWRRYLLEPLHLGWILTVRKFRER